MLIRAPESWPPAVVAVVAMVILAVLDIIGALVSKEAVLQRSGRLAALGLLIYVLLFWVQASSLQYADLAPLTFGWIVAVQIGVVVLDRVRYQVTLPTGAWVAIGVMVVAQAYLLLMVQQSGPEKTTVEAEGSSSTVAAAPAAQDSADQDPLTQLVLTQNAVTSPVTGSPRHHRGSCYVH